MHVMTRLGKSWSKDLFKHIEELRQSGGISDWFANYLNSLRSAGNAQVHLQKSPRASSELTEADTHWLLFTINRAIENWLEVEQASPEQGATTSPTASAGLSR
jgi:hypothetical protein